MPLTTTMRGTMGLLASMVIAGRAPAQGGSVTPAANWIFVVVNENVPVSGQVVFLNAVSSEGSSGSGVHFSHFLSTHSAGDIVPPVTPPPIFDDAGPSTDTDLDIPINNTHGVQASGTITGAPEPATFALVAVGLLGLVGVIHRRKRLT